MEQRRHCTGKDAAQSLYSSSSIAEVGQTHTHLPLSLLLYSRDYTQLAALSMSYKLVLILALLDFDGDVSAFSLPHQPPTVVKRILGEFGDLDTIAPTYTEEEAAVMLQVGYIQGRGRRSDCQCPYDTWYTTET